MDGFSYNGKTLESFGCYYIPNPTDRERGDMMSSYSVYSIDYEARDGGYYFGQRVQPISFELPCYYENITRAQKEAILRW